MHNLQHGIYEFVLLMHMSPRGCIQLYLVCGNAQSDPRGPVACINISRCLVRLPYTYNICIYESHIYINSYLCVWLRAAKHNAFMYMQLARMVVATAPSGFCFTFKCLFLLLQHRVVAVVRKEQSLCCKFVSCVRSCQLSCIVCISCVC